MGNNHSVCDLNSQSNRRSSESVTPLYDACRIGDEKQVRALLPLHSLADLNQQANFHNGNTCLHIAAANGHNKIVALLLKHGCYRSCILNYQNQSAYDMAALSNKSTHSLFTRQYEPADDSAKCSSRFVESDASECFDVIKIDEGEGQYDDDDDIGNNEKPTKTDDKANVRSYKTEEERKHEIEYSASSKAMCQSRVSRFCVNHFHRDEPLNHRTIIKELNRLLYEAKENDMDDCMKINDLLKQYEQNGDAIEQLLHLYTLETKFYRLLKNNCLPLAMPIFINLPKLKARYFKGHVYRGMHMTYDQLLVYQMAMKMPGTVLQTRSFSSTSMNRSVAEQFANSKNKHNDKRFCVLFIFDFPDVCDQAINLTRISNDKPCLSEYEDEQEVLILPWTLFEVKCVQEAANDHDLCTIYLTNIMIPKKNLLSTFKWSFVELKSKLIKENKLQFDCAFQRYKISATKD